MPTKKKAAKIKTSSRAKKMVSQAEIRDLGEKRVHFWLQKLLKNKKVSSRVKVPGKTVEIDFSVCNASKMAMINGSFRGKKLATDVLSFPADGFFQEQGVLGDLVICAPVLVSQAEEFGHSWTTELDVLIVHGLLHLFHFDHEKSKAGAKEMRAMEAKILGKAASRAALISRARK